MRIFVYESIGVFEYTNRLIYEYTTTPLILQNLVAMAAPRLVDLICAD